jgi:hypothetical protein
MAAAVRQESLQHLACIRSTFLIMVESCDAGYETYQEEAESEVNAKDDGSLLAEGGEDGCPFCGDHSAGTSDDSQDVTSSAFLRFARE